MLELNLTIQMEANQFQAGIWLSTQMALFRLLAIMAPLQSQLQVHSWSVILTPVRCTLLTIKLEEQLLTMLKSSKEPTLLLDMEHKWQGQIWYFGLLARLLVKVLNMTPKLLPQLNLLKMLWIFTQHLLPLKAQMDFLSNLLPLDPWNQLLPSQILLLSPLTHKTTWFGLIQITIAHKAMLELNLTIQMEANQFQAGNWLSNKMALFCQRAIMASSFQNQL